MKIAGIDAGCSGAVALLDTDKNSVEVSDIVLDSDRSLDAHWLFGILIDFKPAKVITEYTFKPLSLVQQTGAIRAVSQIVGANHYVVPVTTWKRKMLGTNTNDKEVSITCVKKLMPTTESLLRRNSRCKKDSPDRAEAILLALYGKLHL